MSYKVGQRVICKDDSPGRASKKKLLKKDLDYVVTGNWGTEIYVNGVDGSWDSRRFRLLDEDFASEIIRNIWEQINEENLVLS